MIMPVNMILLEAFQPIQWPAGPVVYALADFEGNMAKIGYTGNLKRRLGPIRRDEHYRVSQRYAAYRRLGEDVNDLGSDRLFLVGLSKFAKEADARALESHIHRQLRKTNWWITGDWYFLDAIYEVMPCIFWGGTVAEVQ